MIFYNCGPEAMIEAAVAIEQRYTPEQNIYNSIDYVTKCGVGVCGSCATSDGHRACVDGPFLQ
jgi:dihydroorotate dehydrogenase (NAD+) catalytic subunit